MVLQSLETVLGPHPQTREALWKPRFPATFVRAKITSLDTLERVVLFSRQVVSDSFAVLWTVAHQAPLSMEFPSQEYCSGLSPPSPGDLPDSGIEPVSSALQELI